MLAEPVERKRAPETVIDAKFSLFFTVALALVRARVSLDDFDAAALHDADIRALATRVHVPCGPTGGATELPRASCRSR